MTPNENERVRKAFALGSVSSVLFSRRPRTLFRPNGARSVFTAAIAESTSAVLVPVDVQPKDGISRTGVRISISAGVTDRLLEVSDLVALWESYERRAERAA